MLKGRFLTYSTLHKSPGLSPHRVCKAESTTPIAQGMHRSHCRAAFGETIQSCLCWYSSGSTAFQGKKEDPHLFTSGGSLAFRVLTAIVAAPGPGRTVCRWTSAPVRPRVYGMCFQQFLKKDACQGILSQTTPPLCLLSRAGNRRPGAADCRRRYCETAWCNGKKDWTIKRCRMLSSRIQLLKAEWPK